jgi:histone H3/H4
MISGKNVVTYKKEALQWFLGEQPMVDVLKKSGVRDAADGVNVGSDFYDALDDEVKRLVERAVERAEDNGRRTVKARDV